MTVVYGTGWAALVLKSTIETDEPVPERASRKPRAALRTVSVAPVLAIDPDSSSTSITSMPHTGVRLGFGAGVVTRIASCSTFSGLSVPEQLLPDAAVKPAS